MLWVRTDARVSRFACRIEAYEYLLNIDCCRHYFVICGCLSDSSKIQGPTERGPTAHQSNTSSKPDNI
jgi:hypothetical protein